MASCQKSDAWRLVCQKHVWHSWWLWFLVGFNFVFMFNFELEAQAKYKWSVLDSAKAVGVGDFEWAAANASEKEFIYLQHCILALHETIAKKCYMSYRPWSFSSKMCLNCRPSQRATSRVMEPTGKVPWYFVVNCRTDGLNFPTWKRLRCGNHDRL